MEIFNNGVYLITKYGADTYFRKIASEHYASVDEAIQYIIDTLSERLTENHGNFVVVFGNINGEDFAASSIHKTWDDFYKWLDITYGTEILTSKYDENPINDFVEDFAYNYLENELFSFRIDDVRSDDDEITLITDESIALNHGEQHQILEEDNFYALVDTIMEDDVQAAIDACNGSIAVYNSYSEYNDNEYNGAEPDGKVVFYVKPIVKNYRKITL